MIVQLRDSKAVRQLVEEGMIREAEERIGRLGERLPMTVKGYVLTPLGHMTYCQSCDQQETP